MKKSLITLAATALFALSGASVMAASHIGAPMAGASAAAMPAASMASAGDLAGSKDDAKAMKKTAAATYKDAKKACKPMKGAEEKACMNDAKLAHEKAEAKSEGIHEMAEAKTDKEKAKVTAKYEKEVAKAEKKYARK
jgi:hypothetical protein